MQGVPAKRVKEVSPEQVENIIRKTANNYHLYSTWFKEEKIKVGIFIYSPLGISSELSPSSEIKSWERA